MCKLFETFVDAFTGSHAQKALLLQLFGSLKTSISPFTLQKCEMLTRYEGN